MISVESCDTEDWLMIISFAIRNKLNVNNIIKVLVYFCSHKCSPGDHKKPLSKNKGTKILSTQTYEKCTLGCIKMPTHPIQRSGGQFRTVKGQSN